MGRPLRGSRLASFYTSDTEADPIAPPSLSTLDSAFQLQEYIGAVVRLNPHDIERIVKVPGRNATADGGEKEREVEGEDERVFVDEACWIYEQLRRLAQDLTHPLITMLQQECTRQTCPEMKAGEWLYLCVAHGNSGAMEHCCAIDYIVHTLDSATALLNSPRAFPSRISIPQTSHRHFPSLARRLGRIFAHAYHHHRLAFESAEAESALYARFLSLSRHFDLVPAEFLVIPERSEQGDGDVGRGSGDMHRKNVTLLTRDSDDSLPSQAATIPTISASPRIGGRARTDTMYLSGGYVSPHGRGSPGVSPSQSPRRIPGPMTATLPEEASQGTATLITLQRDAMDEATAAQEGTVGVPTPEEKDLAEGKAPDAKESPVPLRMPGQVLARDFALEAPLPVVLQDAVGADADAPSAPIENMPSQAKPVDAEKEQDEVSSCPETPGEDASTTSSTPDQLSAVPSDSTAPSDSTVPSDSTDPIPAPPYSELNLAEPPPPDLASHVPEAQPEVEVEQVVAPELEPDPAASEEPITEGATDAAALDEGDGGDEAKEEEVVAEIASSSVLDVQQETEETSVDEAH